jgi:hypothetical protein
MLGYSWGSIMSHSISDKSMLSNVFEDAKRIISYLDSVDWKKTHSKKKKIANISNFFARFENKRLFRKTSGRI